MFNSRDRRFRNPTGAVASGENVHFKIMLPRDLKATGALLITKADGALTAVQGMFWCGMNGEDMEFWECDFTPDNSGLYFYHFEIMSERGRLKLCRGAGGEGVFESTQPWQLTVYKREFTTPEWLSGGIIYQIFPDRFCSYGQEMKNIPYGRTMHENWEDMPLFEPNEQGEITNSDFFGGNLKGIIHKLPYIASLGVNCIYLNPVFESHSNHRYDTADYSVIDPLLGNEEDLKTLCDEAEKLGIKVILDGVFSHTGSDSVYFNKQGRYGADTGAFRSQESPYFSWYSFKEWPESYDCWWDINTLPNVKETEESYNKYINGENGIVRKWLKAGVSGWRLDVADELPDGFLDELKKAVKSEKPDALILGEVWEDASNKIAYDIRRRYLLGDQLDTVMNYPFRDAVLEFLLNKDHWAFKERVENITENYPPQCIRLLMNHIGTHDTARAITILAGEPVENRDRRWQSRHFLSEKQKKRGVRLLKLASLMQFTLPGVPSIYYGDEAGVEGYRDPFNRRTYPWGKEDAELIDWYRGLGSIRKKHKDILAQGGFSFMYGNSGALAYRREEMINGKLSTLKVFINASFRAHRFSPSHSGLFSGKTVLGMELSSNPVLPPYGFSVIRE